MTKVFAYATIQLKIVVIKEMEKKAVLDDLRVFIEKESQLESSFRSDDNKFLVELMSTLETAEQLLLEKKKSGKTVSWLRNEKKLKDEIAQENILIKKEIQEVRLEREEFKKKVVWLRGQRDEAKESLKKQLESIEAVESALNSSVHECDVLKKELSIKNNVNRFKVDYLHKSHLLSSSSKKLVSVKSSINNTKYRVSPPLSKLYGELSQRKDLFDSEMYLRENQDVATSLICPLYHFLINGIIEERMLENFPEFYLVNMQYIKTHFSI